MGKIVFFVLKGELAIQITHLSIKYHLVYIELLIWYQNNQVSILEMK
jgi:hypothetical protein